MNSNSYNNNYESGNLHAPVNTDPKTGLAQSGRLGNSGVYSQNDALSGSGTYSAQPVVPEYEAKGVEPSKMRGVGQQLKGSIEHGWGKVTGNPELAQQGEQIRLAGKAEKHAARANSHASSAAYSDANASREEAKSDIKMARGTNDQQLYDDARIRKTQANNTLDALNRH